jgi:hypothetical protein
LEIVPPVAMSRTFGRRASGCAWAAAAADADANVSADANVKTRAKIRSRSAWRIAPLYLSAWRIAPLEPSACLPVCEREPAAELLRGFIGSAAVERHQRCGSAGGPCDLRAPLIVGDAQHFDNVLTPIDGLFETVDIHGGRRKTDVTFAGETAF